MGTVRVCGKRCHTAKRPMCLCWCGGLFHGAPAQKNRDAFAAALNAQKLPTTERAFTELTSQGDFFGDSRGERWREALRAAVAARDAGLVAHADAASR